MIIPLREKDIVRLFRCPVCGLIWRDQPGDTRMSCLVTHSPGTCCHYGEHEISVDMLAAVMVALGEKEQP